MDWGFICSTLAEDADCEGEHSPLCMAALPYLTQCMQLCIGALYALHWLSIGSTLAPDTYCEAGGNTLAARSSSACCAGGLSILVITSSSC